MNVVQLGDGPVQISIDAAFDDAALAEPRLANRRRRWPDTLTQTRFVDMSRELLAPRLEASNAALAEPAAQAAAPALKTSEPPATALTAPVAAAAAPEAAAPEPRRGPRVGGGILLGTGVATLAAGFGL